MTVVAIPPGDGRVALLPLLFLADSSEDHVRAHVGDGHVFALVDDGTVIGAATSNAGISEIAYYQKCGFRLLSVERDDFDAARGYAGTEMENGIVHRDLVWFDQSLI